MGYKVAVIGATGNVGREMLQTLVDREFPVDEVIALASERSIGREVSFGEDKTLKVQDLAKFDFKGVDIALSSPGAKVSAVHSPRAAAAGCVVIDNTSHFRMDPDVPLVVPEVNAKAIAGYKKRNIIANPNCSTIQMVVALKPLHDLARIKRVVVATYQSVSGAGKEAMDELFEQTRGIYMNAHARAEQVHQADRLQRHPAYRRLHGRRLHQGRVEDAGRDPQDPRPRHRRHRHLRARARLHRPCRGGQRRVREADHRRAGARGAAQGAGHVARSTIARTKAMSRRVECAGEDAVYRQPHPQGPDGRRTASRCGWSPTTCARVPRSTRSRSPSAWCKAISRTPAPRASASAHRRQRMRCGRNAGSRGSN